jgi:hypothetical protein
MKTKIELSRLAEMSIKEFQADAQREFKRLAAAGETTNIVVLTDFDFKCGNTGAVVIVGDYSGDLQKFYKEQKTVRAKAQKDYGLGTCYVKDGQAHIDLQEGAAKVSDLIKGLKKVKINFETVITKNAAPEKVEAEKVAPEKVEASKENVANAAKEVEKDKKEIINTAIHTALAQGLDKVKAQFQKMRDILPRAVANSMTKEDFGVFAVLQQQIQQWFASFTASAADEQTPYKEQAQKLKEQYSKIASLIQKNKN